jgi:hypothetical protein
VVADLSDRYSIDPNVSSAVYTPGITPIRDGVLVLGAEYGGGVIPLLTDIDGRLITAPPNLTTPIVTVSGGPVQLLAVSPSNVATLDSVDIRNRSTNNLVIAIEGTSGTTYATASIQNGSGTTIYFHGLGVSEDLNVFTDGYTADFLLRYRIGY